MRHETHSRRRLFDNPLLNPVYFLNPINFDAVKEILTTGPAIELGLFGESTADLAILCGCSAATLPFPIDSLAELRRASPDDETPTLPNPALRILKLLAETSVEYLFKKNGQGKAPIQMLADYELWNSVHALLDQTDLIITQTKAHPDYREVYAPIIEAALIKFIQRKDGIKIKLLIGKYETCRLAELPRIREIIDAIKGHYREQADYFIFIQLLENRVEHHQLLELLFAPNLAGRCIGADFLLRNDPDGFLNYLELVDERNNETTSGLIQAHFSTKITSTLFDGSPALFDRILLQIKNTAIPEPRKKKFNLIANHLIDHLLKNYLNTGDGAQLKEVLNPETSLGKFFAASPHAIKKVCAIKDFLIRDQTALLHVIRKDYLSKEELDDLKIIAVIPEGSLAKRIAILIHFQIRNRATPSEIAKTLLAESCNTSSSLGHFIKGHEYRCDQYIVAHQEIPHVLDAILESIKNLAIADTEKTQYHSLGDLLGEHLLQRCQISLNHRQLKDALNHTTCLGNFFTKHPAVIEKICGLRSLFIAEITVQLQGLKAELNHIFAANNREIKLTKILALRSLRHALATDHTQSISEHIENARRNNPGLESGCISHRTLELLRKYTHKDEALELAIPRSTVVDGVVTRIEYHPRIAIR